MSRTVINTEQAPQAIGPYSQAIVAGSFIYTSGQVGLDPKTMTLDESFEKQAHRIFDNLQHILLAAGSSFSHLIKLNIYLTDMGHYRKLNEIMTERLPSPYPARTTVVVSQLPAQALVEVEAVALKTDS